VTRRVHGSCQVHGQREAERHRHVIARSLTVDLLRSAQEGGEIIGDLS
jgi:hypothetical protein